MVKSGRGARVWPRVANREPVEIVRPGEELTLAQPLG
jgi:hypothetical protein